jgi:hypothetical protein
MMNQNGEFLLWISLSAIMPQKETVICPSLIIVASCEIFLAQKADFLGFITVFLGEMPIRFHRGWCVSAY